MFGNLQRIFAGALSLRDEPQDAAEQLRLATSVLLMEAAHADREFSDAERAVVTKVIRTRFSLDDAAAHELLTAAEQAREESGDLYQFARLLNQNYPMPRKLAVIELLWDVIYSDGVLESHEDALMHKLGNLLGVRHEDLMTLKSSARARAPKNVDNGSNF